MFKMQGKQPSNQKPGQSTSGQQRQATVQPKHDATDDMMEGDYDMDYSSGWGHTKIVKTDYFTDFKDVLRE